MKREDAALDLDLIARHSALSGASALLLTLALAAWPTVAVAQATAVIADVGSHAALGTTVIRSGANLEIGGGTLSGANLFHSFSKFSLGGGDTARWTRSGAGDIRNVINRVTGGEVSRIAGTLDSTELPNASFFFLNPAGVVFTRGAQVNVPGAAYFSTASNLRFSDGSRFVTASSNSSTLTMAAPQSFGFVGGEEAIAVRGVGETFAPARATLSLIASGVEVTGSRFALRGLDLVAVTGGGVEVVSSQLTVSPSGLDTGSLRIVGGDVTIDASTLASDTAGGVRGGDVLVSADSLRIAGGSQLGVSSRSIGAGGGLSLTAGRLEGDRATFFTFNSGDATGGTVSLSADVIDFRDVTVASSATGAGAGGGIEVSADGLSGQRARFTAQATGSGRGGSVTLDARFLDLTDSAAAANARGSGGAGDVTLYGDEILLSGGTFGSIPGVAVESGSLTVDAGSYLEIAGAELSVATNDARTASISLRGAEVRILDTLVRSTAFGGGDPGSISVLGDHLVIRSSELLAEARGGRAVGSIQLAATGNIELDIAAITSSASGAAQGGVVTIEGKDVRLDSTFVLSETDGDGRAGNVSIKADRLLMQFGSISSNTYGTGEAGLVSLVARGIVLANSASVTSDTFGAGHAGGVTVVAGEVVVADNASITSETSIGSGNAGEISIVSESLKISNGFVSSDTEGQGNAGAVNIRTGTLLVTNPDGAGAYISSDTLGDGDAGDVIIQAKSVTISDQGVISSTSFESGDAGSVVITAETLLLDGGTISSAADLGSRGGSGDLRLQVDEFAVINGGRISTASFSPKAAGQIQVVAGRLSIDGPGSFISSENFSGGPAAGSRSGPVGDAGSVGITAVNLTASNGGRITTNSFGGAAGDISITMPSLGLLTLEGRSAVGSIQTSSGAGTGGRIAITGPQAIISNGGSILALGQQSGANVTIQTRNFISSTDRRNTVAVDGQIRLEAGLHDLSSGTVNPDISVLDASKVLQGQCPAARAAGVVSQLITRPVGPYAREHYVARPPSSHGPERSASGSCN